MRGDYAPRPTRPRASTEESAENGAAGGAPQLAREGAEDVPREGARESTEDYAREGALESIESAREGVREGAQEGAQDDVREGTSQGAREGAQAGAQEGAKESSREGTEEGSHEGTEEGSREGTPEDTWGGARERTGKSAQPARAGGLGRDIREALRYLWAHRFLRTLAISAGMLNTASAAYFGVLVLWLVGPGSRVGLAPEGYGLMMSALAVGSVAGSLVAERLTGMLGEGRTLLVAWLVSALLYLVPVLVPVAWVLYPTAVLWGVAGGAGNVLVVSIRQRVIPSTLLGRVNSAYRLVGMGGMPVGAALGGVLGEIAGLPAVFLGAAGVALAAVGLVWRVARGPISMPLTSDHSVRRTSASV
ncbi:MFS transporter [Nonomuraea rhodomycinica]|uniref:MFS transporter n=2 Tax=Nonomuraea rhodomycinica TaxID=1712872 RepID=A0A7Y6IK33_9ACTN|nr:MFS transporter [Nonomuraea rhodomycinica]